MSFVNTGKVEEGDLVTVAILNQIKDNINAAHTALGADAYNWGAPINPEHAYDGALKLEGSLLSFFHRFRWLAYGSTGVIIDPSGVGDDVTLSDPEAGTIGFHDLESIEWLTYGMYYRVEGVTWAQEYDIRI
jgi:hypothetical protein